MESTVDESTARYEEKKKKKKSTYALQLDFDLSTRVLIIV
jgi:hypothetical protein